MKLSCAQVAEGGKPLREDALGDRAGFPREPLRAVDRADHSDVQRERVVYVHSGPAAPGVRSVAVALPAKNAVATASGENTLRGMAIIAFHAFAATGPRRAPLAHEPALPGGKALA